MCKGLPGVPFNRLVPLVSSRCVFEDLRRLADSLDAQLACELGAPAIPLLGRVLAGADVERRERARTALVALAATAARPRVLAGVNALVASAITDDAKVCALGLLVEIGAPVAPARFADPVATEERSAHALAASLDSPLAVARAAELLVTRASVADALATLDLLAAADRDAAHRLGAELAARLELPLTAADRARLAASAPASEPGPPADVAVLADLHGRTVVIAWRGPRRWATLVGEPGQIERCIHDELAGGAAELIARLGADGYRVVATDLAHARAVVVAAARRTTRAAAPLPGAFYLGRDLLDLGAAHVPPSAHPAELDRVTHLLAAGDHASARDAAAPSAELTAACLAAAGELANALPHLERAAAAEPAWPLHHWNLAAVHHGLGDARATYHALRRFLATSAAPTALRGDPDQAARIAGAERLVLEIERAMRLTGSSLAKPRKRRAATSSRARRRS
jgi:hypothetical protein